MVPPTPPGPRRGARALLVGPGPRAAELAAVLGALGAGEAVRALADVAELGALADEEGLLVLDAEAVPLEDVGYVRRFLAARPAFALALVGAEPGARSARRLAALGAARWIAWPPDLDGLRALVAEVAGPTSVRAAPTARPAPDAPRSTPASPAQPTPAAAAPQSLDELDQVRAILAGSEDDEHALPAPAPAAPAFERFEEVEPAAAAASTTSFPPADAGPFDAGAAADAEPAADLEETAADEETGASERAGPARFALDAPPWLRAQVADLADTAQRIDLSLQALGAAAPDVAEGEDDAAHEAFEALQLEVARFVQFTRTLGYLVAPPAAGAQAIDLSEMLHLFAANLAASGPDAPRCQFRSPEPVRVRSDRQLLAQALDALFFLARSTSEKGNLVRAQVQREEGPGGARALVRIDFPSGPLEGLGEDEVLTPYGLTDLFPDLGPNALAAAAGIVAGQGGTLRLASPRPGRLEWRLELPLAP